MSSEGDWEESVGAEVDALGEFSVVPDVVPLLPASVDMMLAMGQGKSGHSS